MNAIDAVFQRLRAQGRKAFVPFVTAGDPDLAFTGRVAGELASRGAAVLEIGFPHSDPIADGPVIQASYTRALEHGVRIDQILSWAAELTRSKTWQQSGAPLVAMVSYSLVHRGDPDGFVARARAAGFSGAIVPDLPVEESASLARIARQHDFKLIQLVTPGTSRDRALRIAETSTGFLYCVSVTGITGQREQLPGALLDQLHWLREHTPLPLCVGFGIGKPEQVRMLREAVDGIIVGSALVRHLESASRLPADRVLEEIGSLAQSLAEALNPDAPGI